MELRNQNDQIILAVNGAGRLSARTESVPLFGSQNAKYAIRSVVHYTGKRSYELNNLPISIGMGNVLSVISDKVIPHQNGSSVDYWLADIRQSSYYSPFGVLLKGRDLPLTSGSVPYRYGYQGSERDDEIKGAGNSYNYEYRMHDPRIGRFFAVDPLAPKYPHNSPYAFSENMVIHAIEVEGLEAHVFYKAADPGSTAKHELVIGMKVSLVDERNNPNSYTGEDLSKLYRDRVRALSGTSTNGRIDFQVAVIGAIDIAESAETAQHSIVIHVVDDNDEKLSFVMENGEVGYAAAKTVLADGTESEDAIGDTQGFHIYIGQTSFLGNDRGRSVPHETGHGLGLRHPVGTIEHPNIGNSDRKSGITTSESPQNIMRQSIDTDGTLLLRKQINTIIQEVLKDTGQKLYQKSNGDPTWKPKDSSGNANRKFKFD